MKYAALFLIAIAAGLAGFSQTAHAQQCGGGGWQSYSYCPDYSSSNSYITCNSGQVFQSYSFGQSCPSLGGAVFSAFGGYCQTSSSCTSTPVPTVSLSANPSSIKSGQSSTLQWSSSNATNCSAYGAWFGTEPTSGSQTVTPSSTSTYYLDCFASDGITHGSASATVTIAQNSPPNAPSLPAGPNSGTAGTSYTYSTSTADPNGDNIYYIFYWGDGSSYSTGFLASGNTAVASHVWSSTGSYYVAVQAFDTSGASSLTSPTLAVSMGSNIATTVSLWATPSSITSGQSSTLQWSTSSSVTSCSASGAWTGTKKILSGTEVVYPNSTSTYYLACSGPNGSATSSATITVAQSTLPPQIAYFSGNPQTSTVFSSYEVVHPTISWSSINTTSCSGSGNGWDGPVNGATSGSATLSISLPPGYSSVGYNYYLDCFGSNGAATTNTTIGIVEDYPPSTPSRPFGPDTPLAGSSYGYSTSANDSNGDSIKYLFNWGDGSPTTETPYGASGIAQTAYHTWSAAGTYSITAQAVDIYGATSGTSLPLTITVQQPACAKNTTPQQSAASVTLQNGRVCSLTLKHLGADATDNSAVSYESINSGTNVRSIAMSDDTATCNNNLKWHTTWDTLLLGGHNFFVGSTVDDYSATHTLQYGFQLSTSNCAIADQVNACSGATCPVVSVTSAPDGHSITVLGTKGNVSNSTNSFAMNFNIVECTQSSQCTDSSKPACNTSMNVCVADNPPDVTIFSTPNQWYSTNPLLAVSFSDDIGLAGGAYTVDVNPATNPAAPISIPSVSGKAYSTSSFSMSSATWNTLSQGSHTIYLEAFDSAGQCRGCDGTKTLTINKDTLAPSSAINETQVASGKRCDQNCNTTAPVYSYWFGKDATYAAKTYNISVADSDGAGSGIDLNSCLYTVQDSGTGKTRSNSRTCNSVFSITVGPASSGADCQTQGQVAGVGQCVVTTWSTDLAGNSGVIYKNLNIDYTPPTAQ